MAKAADSERVLRLTGGHEIAGCTWDERHWNTSCRTAIMIGIR